jgi:cytochrome c-type biogenesis protein CcmH
VTARLLVLLLLALPASLASAATPPSDVDVAAVASQLRCVVCQSLSVADSPSEMATQMRGIVRERLAAGETPEQVVRYFVDKYGEWILLAPPRRGFTLLVWILPPLAVLLGLALTIHRVRGWTRRPPAARVGMDAAMRERIRKELEAEP